MLIGEILAMPKYEIKLILSGNIIEDKMYLGEFQADTQFEAEKKCRKMYKNLINDRSKLETKEVK
jgi:hypothetical protein